MKHYILTVVIRVAEVENYMHRLVSMDEEVSVEDAIHDYMKEYWGEETVTQETGKRYHREWQESLKVESYRQLKEDEYQTMKPYLMEW